MTRNQRVNPLDRLRPAAVGGDRAPVGDRHGDDWSSGIDVGDLSPNDDSRGRHRSGAPPTPALSVGSVSRAALGTVAVAAVAITVAAALLWWWSHTQRPDDGLLLGTTALASSASAVEPMVTSSAPAGVTVSTAASVTVHVAGAVADPGLVVLITGSRVMDAVAAAGGLTAGAAPDGVNLARLVVDGEMVVVPTPGQVVAMSPVPGAGGATAASGSLVDVNRADVPALETLPGIGPVLAERIVAHRQDSGPFATVEDLRAVPGIGEKVFDGLRDHVTV